MKTAKELLKQIQDLKTRIDPNSQGVEITRLLKLQQRLTTEYKRSLEGQGLTDDEVNAEMKRVQQEETSEVLRAYSMGEMEFSPKKAGA